MTEAQRTEGQDSSRERQEPRDTGDADTPPSEGTMRLFGAFGLTTELKQKDR